jgi:hypothetical protein
VIVAVDSQEIIKTVLIASQIVTFKGFYEGLFVNMFKYFNFFFVFIQNALSICIQNIFKILNHIFLKVVNPIGDDFNIFQKVKKAFYNDLFNLIDNVSWQFFVLHVLKNYRINLVITMNDSQQYDFQSKHHSL